MLHKLVLGTVQFGINYGINNRSGKPGAGEVKGILDLAYTNNIHLLDTAEAYGNSQEVIGNYHRQSKNKFEIITKYSASRTDLSSNFEERIEQNLRILETDHLYGYMFHSFRDFESCYPQFKHRIRRLKQGGVIKKFGVSVYTNAELNALTQLQDIDLVQLPFNLLDNDKQRGELITKAKEKGIEIHTRSVFLQGLFFMNRNQLPEKLKILKPYLDQIESIALDSGAPMNDIALQYVLQQNNIDKVLIGVDTVQQLEQNIKAIHNQVAPGIFRRIDGINVSEVELLNPANWN